MMNPSEKKETDRNCLDVQESYGWTLNKEIVESEDQSI